jgi:dTDP-L-rhamnose 4-epimerase
MNGRLSVYVRPSACIIGFVHSFIDLSTTRITGELLPNRILILGGTGFIGSHLAAELVRLGHEVTLYSRNPDLSFLDKVHPGTSQRVRCIKGSINDCDMLAKALSEAEIVYHNAAATGVEASAIDSAGFVETNIKGTAVLSSVLRTGQYPVQKIILASSISVYGEGNYFCSSSCGTVRPSLRYDSERFNRSTNWEPVCPKCGGAISPSFTPENAERYGESIYAITKKAQEDLMLSLSHQAGISLVSLRYCTVFGPNQPTTSPYSRFARQLLEGQAPRVYEDGKQSRDFIYISDVVNANIAALSSDVGGFFNIGSGIQTPLIEFLDRLKKSLEQHVSRVLPSPEITGTLCRGDVRHCYADVSKANAQLGISACQDLDSGIEKLASSFSRLETASGTRP